MRQPPAHKRRRVLAIAPSSKGFGFAVIEGKATLVGWGLKPVKGDKNRECLKRVRSLLVMYRPNLVALQDPRAKDCRRAPRIRALLRGIAGLAAKEKVRVKLCSMTALRKAYFGDRQGTKRELAVALTHRFPQELAPRLPPKRRPWQSEDFRMDIFDAVALALMVA